MIIFWFSEIKWNYLRTRKQQILSRFHKDNFILFIEPISRIINNKFTLQDNKPICNITIPQLRSVANPFILYIINLKLIRKCIFLFSTIWFFVFQFLLKKKPDVIITSNVFWIDTIKLLLKKYPNIKLIYDCNDDPLSFSTIPISTKEYFSKTVSISNRIVVPHKSYIEFIPKHFHNKIEIISNGVDYNAFQRKNTSLSLIENNSNPIVMYVGAISDWFDYNLLESIARTLYNIHFFLIGPIGSQSKHKLELLTNEKNISYIPTIPHDEIINYLNYADVCIIPFLKTELTSTILPNKIFEYSAAGKPCVMTNFNNYLYEFDNYIFIAKNEADFISKILSNIDTPPSQIKLKDFSSKYDWEKISNKFYIFLNKIIHEQVPIKDVYHK